MSSLPTQSQSSPTPTTFYKLPPELIATLLSHIPPSLLQRTTYSIIQVFPDLGGVSQKNLFKYLHITQAKQVKPLWFRLLKDKEQGDGVMLKSVETFMMGSWRADADIMNNVLRMLPSLKVIMLNLGTNVAPDHLSECFDKPRPLVNRIELRFRPYVDKASYFQFLKGVYFDSAIESLSRKWPQSESFTHLALVQDVPPRFSNPHLLTMIERLSLRGPEDEGGNSISGDPNLAGEIDAVTAEDLIETNPIEPRGYTGHSPFPYLGEKLQYARPKTFAQPICFFDIQCMSRLGRSDAGRYLTHLRLRVPTRDIAKVMSEIGDARIGRSTFPSLRYLDISTTNVRIDGWLPHLLKRYERLETLILDRTNLFGFAGGNTGPELCHELGKLCVMMGMTRGKDREREIGAWELGLRRAQAIKEREARRNPPSVPGTRRRMTPTTSGTTTEGESEVDGDGEDGDGSEAELEVVGNGLVNNGAGGPIISESNGPITDTPATRALGRASRRTHRSAGMANFSIRESNLRTRRSNALASTQEDLPLPPPTELHIVLPPLPTIQSICVGGETADLSQSNIAKWDLSFHLGWLEGLQKVEEWAARQYERYERAVRAARQWHVTEEQERMRNGGKDKNKQKSSKGKAEVPLLPKVKVRPPLDIKLYRYPRGEELSGPLDSSENPLEGLIEIKPEDIDGKEDWKAPYDLALEDATAFVSLLQSQQNSENSSRSLTDVYSEYPTQPVLCLIPDCEGPMRRGEDGQRDDGRSGMILKEGKLEEDKVRLSHAPGCGHMHGRRTWGWREE